MAATTDAAVTASVLIDGTTPTSPSQGPAATTPSTATTASLFEDLHSPPVYEKTKARCKSEETLNFVVDFDHEKAEVAFDLKSEEVKDLLNSGTPKGKVRWINIWTPTAQPLTMRAIGDHYGFSSRLQAILTMRPPEPTQAKEPPNMATRPSKSGANGAVQTSESVLDKGDVEHGSPATETRLQREVPASLKKDLAMYRIVKDTMGFTSVDQGPRFICLGANWLHERGEDNGELLQPKHWSWLTLCADYTVISIQETPVFEHPDNQELCRKELKNMRSNAVGILYQLSQLGIEEFKDNVIGLKSVRDTMKPEPGQNGGAVRRTTSDFEPGSGSDPQVEGSSNLFYYLFEDYGGAATILEVSKKIVSDLDERVLASARRRAKLKTRDIIPHLHTLRKELRQLQNLFQSYKNMIRRISHPRHATTHGEVPSGPIRLSGDVKISQSARSRFDRLEDRLQMLMLNTIQECLEEQTALSDTFFKITTQKDSQATARLTGSATLLAKLSVFFLPISFMTAFFSVEIPNFVEGYTPNTYYVAFGVIAGLSFVALFFFSKLLMFFSDMLEDWADGLMRKIRKKKD